MNSIHRSLDKSTSLGFFEFVAMSVSSEESCMCALSWYRLQRALLNLSENENGVFTYRSYYSGIDKNIKMFLL